MQGALGAAERPLQEFESLRIVVVAVDIAQERREFGEDRRIDAAGVIETVLGSGAKLVDAPARFGDPDDREVYALVTDEPKQSREDLLEGEIPGRAKKDDRVGLSAAHSGSRWLFVVAAELEAHRRHQLVRVFGRAPGFEPAEQRRAQHRRRHALVDRRLEGPATFARIRDAAGELGEIRIGAQRGRRQVEQPGPDHAAAPPDLRHPRDVDVELIKFGVAQRRRLGVHDLLLSPTFA